jgi:hypothetical protein
VILASSLTGRRGSPDGRVTLGRASSADELERRSIHLDVVKLESATGNTKCANKNVGKFDCRWTSNITLVKTIFPLKK